MTITDIRKFTRNQPFKSFRLTLTNGEEFDIRHPDMIVAGSGMVYLQRPGSRTQDEEADVFHASMLHVLKIEYLTEVAAPPVDRSTV